MQKTQKIVLACLAVLIVAGLFLLFTFQDDGSKGARAMSQNIDNLRKIRKQKDRNPNGDYFQRKEELLWGGGQSGGREPKDPPKTPFDYLLGD